MTKRAKILLIAAPYFIGCLQLFNLSYYFQQIDYRFYIETSVLISIFFFFSFLGFALSLNAKTKSIIFYPSLLALSLLFLTTAFYSMVFALGGRKLIVPFSNLSFTQPYGMLVFMIWPLTARFKKMS